MSTKFKAWLAGASAVVSSLGVAALSHAAASFVVPTGTAASFTAIASQQLTDAGTIEVLAIAVGIPLGFYIIHQLIGLIPKGKAKRA